MCQNDVSASSPPLFYTPVPFQFKDLRAGPTTYPKKRNRVRNYFLCQERLLPLLRRLVGLLKSFLCFLFPFFVHLLLSLLQKSFLLADLLGCKFLKQTRDGSKS